MDRAASERFYALPASPLRTLIVASVDRSVADAANAPFSALRMNSANQCPLLTPERLCPIHAGLGESMLPGVCASYPRVGSSVPRGGGTLPGAFLP